MSDAWRELDLAGGGLQGANIRLAAMLRRRRVAYALLALFPLGLHRAYLHDRRGARLYCSGTLLGIAALLFGQTLLAGLTLAAGIAFAIYDLARIDDAVTRVNKRLRTQVYLSQNAGAPRGFKGHYTDDPSQSAEQEHRDAGQDPAASIAPHERIPGFAEQEKRLRELAAMRKKGRR